MKDDDDSKTRWKYKVSKNIIEMWSGSVEWKVLKISSECDGESQKLLGLRQEKKKR